MEKGGKLRNKREKKREKEERSRVLKVNPIETLLYMNISKFQVIQSSLILICNTR
jgi:hypothetical protein